MLTANASLTEMVNEISKIREQVNALSKRESELKEQVKLLMGPERLMVAGNYAVLIETRKRADLDKKALTEALGLDLIKQYTKEISYEVMSIKPVGG